MTAALTDAPTLIDPALTAGYQPSLKLDAEATLTAEFSDGIRTRWLKGRPIALTESSCGATGVCLHRVIVVLEFAAQTAAASATASSPLSSPTSLTATSPGAASDAALAALLPAALLAQAHRERAAGMSIEVRQVAAGEPCATVRLPAATVRYWAGEAIEAARCDCVQQAACAHVALGVWAFRLADQLHPGQAACLVQLGERASSVVLSQAPYMGLLHSLLNAGVISGATVHAQPISSALHAAREAQAEWLLQTVSSLEAWSAAYAARSARYSATTGADLVTELLMRLTVGAQPGNAMRTLGRGNPVKWRLIGCD